MTTQAVVLGLGSMFNHSSNPYRQNVAWMRDSQRQVVVYTSLRHIERGEELCISYGGGLWFEDLDADDKGNWVEDGGGVVNGEVGEEGREVQDEEDLGALGRIEVEV